MEKFWVVFKDKLNEAVFFVLFGIVLLILGSSDTLSLGSFSYTTSITQWWRLIFLIPGLILIFIGIWRIIRDRSQVVNLVDNEKDLYDAAIYQIKHNKFDVIRIYAPVGFWQDSDHKIRWFKELSDYLDKNPDAEARLIFGVPYWKSAYDKMKRSLQVFNNNPRAVIHYSPPAAKQDIPPLIGMIVFGSDIVTFALGLGESFEKTDTGWAIQDKEIVNTAGHWFDRIWFSYSEHELKSPRVLSIDEGFRKLEEEYTFQFTDER